VFKALYSNALFRPIGDLEFKTIVELCTSRKDSFNCCFDNCFLNINDNYREGRTIRTIRNHEFHILLFTGYMLLPLPASIFEFRYPKFPLFKAERLFRQLINDVNFDAEAIQYEVEFIKQTFIWIPVISIGFRIFKLLLVYLTGKQYIYPSLVPAVFKLLISLALLRPISDSESETLDKWYVDHSTRMRLVVYLDSPALNYCEVYGDDDTSEDSNINENIIIENNIDIFNFMIYLLFEMKFFKRDNMGNA
ncbi:9990_t:CDS:2, partial [Gigaspora rosea]